MLVSDPTRRILLAELQQSPDEAADPEQPPRCPYCPCYLLYLLEHVAAAREAWHCNYNGTLVRNQQIPYKAN